MEARFNLQSCLSCTLYSYLLVLSASGLFLHLYWFLFFSIFPLLLSNGNTSCLRFLFNSKTTTKNVLTAVLTLMLKLNNPHSCITMKFTVAFDVTTAYNIIYSFCVILNSGSELFEFGLLHVKSN